METTSARPLAVFSSPPATNNRRSLELALAAAQTAEEDHGRAIVILDLRQLTPMFDYFVIATADNERQLRALIDTVESATVEAAPDVRMHQEGAPEGGWILLDLGTVVVHLFSIEQRARYNLEGLWRRAQEVVRVQ